MTEKVNEDALAIARGQLTVYSNGNVDINIIDTRDQSLCDPPITPWECCYCGRSNSSEYVVCHGCGSSQRT